MSIYIQWLDSNHWTTLVSIPDESNAWQVNYEMKSVQEKMNGKRVRAVNEDGALVDILS